MATGSESDLSLFSRNWSTHAYGDRALSGIECVHFVVFGFTAMPWTDERASCSGRVCLNRNAFLHRTLSSFSVPSQECRVLDQLVLDRTANILSSVAHVHMSILYWCWSTLPEGRHWRAHP